MSKVKVQYVRPGPFGLREALGRFSQRGGLVSAVSDDKLRVLQQEIGEDGEVEVLPIGQLVGRFLNVQGEPYGRLANKGLVRALIARACEELDSDSPFAKVARFPGFHHAMQQVLDDLAHADWDEWDLERAANGLDPADADRVRSVATIRRSVEAMMDELQLERLQDWVRRSLALESLRPHPIGSVLVFGGPDPHPLLRLWAEWAASTGTRLTWIEERFGFEGADGEHWTDALFTDRIAGSTRPSVTLQVAADPLAECEWALREAAVSKLAGTFDHRITIVARSPETYAPLLLSAAKRLGVPVDASLPVPLSTNAFVAWTNRLLSALAGSDVRALMSCVAGSYSGLDREGRAEADRAIGEAYREGSSAWQALKAWCEHEAERQPWLAHAVRWRATICEARMPVGAWHARLRELVVGPVTPTTVFETGGGDAPTSERDLRAQTAMFRAVAQHALAHDRFGADGLDLAGFADLATDLWKSEDVVLPSEGFGIRLASRAASVGPSDQVIVLGMLEGSFPRRPTEDAILPDDVRANLNRELSDKAPLPLAADIPNIERREFVRLCAAAERSLILSHPETDEETGSIPAFFLEEVERAVEDDIHRKVYTRDTLTPTEPMLPADQELRLAFTGPKAYPPSPFLHSVSARLAIKAPTESGIRPEELATALECPFRSAFRYRLKLFPSTRRDPWRRLRRLPRDARLAMATDEAAARNAFTFALDEALDRLLGEFEPWELEFFRTTADSWIGGWIRREFAARRRWHEEGGERVGPLGFGDAPLRNKVRGVRLEGTVGALSMLGPYAVIHRFDDTAPSFAGSDEVAFGLTLLTAFHASEGKAIALEHDDGNQRRLFILPRFGSNWLHGNVKEGLHVHEVLSEGSDLTEIRESFAKKIVKLTQEAVDRLRVSDAKPTPGVYCKTCQYGEICRTSVDFPETPIRFERVFIEEEA